MASSGLRVQNSTAPSTIALRWGGGYYRARGELRDAVIQLTPEFGKNKFQTQPCIFLLTFNWFPWFKSVFGSQLQILETFELFSSPISGIGQDGRRVEAMIPVLDQGVDTSVKNNIP